MYTIPQFQILSVELTCHCVCVCVCVRDLSNSLVVQADMIGPCMNMGDMKSSKGVYVLWEWDVIIDDNGMEDTDEYKENVIVMLIPKQMLTKYLHPILTP